MEQVEFSIDETYYWYKGTKVKAEKRFLNNIEWKLIFGKDVTNTAVTLTVLPVHSV